MAPKFCLLFAIVVTSMVFLGQNVEGRYLPTRSNGDKLDKLRELLKEDGHREKVEGAGNSKTLTRKALYVIAVDNLGTTYAKTLIFRTINFLQLLETEIENNEYYDNQPRWHPDSKLFYKREVKTH